MKRTFLFLILIIFLLLLSACTALLIDQDFERRKQYVQTHPEVDTYIKTIISQGKIVRGMTEDQVKASWGHPYDINRSVGSWGVREQWCYGYWHYGWRPTSFLYFKNGTLDSWQKL